MHKFSKHEIVSEFSNFVFGNFLNLVNFILIIAILTNIFSKCPSEQMIHYISQIKVKIPNSFEVLYFGLSLLSNNFILNVIHKHMNLICIRFLFILVLVEIRLEMTYFYTTSIQKYPLRVNINVSLVGF